MPSKTSATSSILICHFRKHGQKVTLKQLRMANSNSAYWGLQRGHPGGMDFVVLT